MLRRVAVTLLVLASIAGFLAVGGGAPAVYASALSAPTPGSSAETALPVPSSPTTVALGQRIWYGFQYAGDDSPILIDMSAAPGGSANFAVYTPGDTATPVGRGSPQTMTRRQADGTIEETLLYGGDLIWSGSFRSPGVYYVVVEQHGPTGATINLKVTGSGVSAIPGAAAQPVVAAAPTVAVAACTPIAPPKTLSADGPGSTPGQALPLPTEGAYLLSVGQRAWYAFQYTGDGSQILIDLRATPDKSASFAVYTPDNTRTPVGRGSQQTTTRRLPNGASEEVTLYGGDLVWSGSFRSPGAYYVAVDQRGVNPSTFWLGISGRGVSGGQTVKSLPSSFPPGPICAPLPTPAPASETLSAGGPGTTPGRALPLPTDGVYVLPVGQRAWYGFQYAGDGSQILIDLHATPDNSASFALYTPDNLETPVGRGSRQTTTRRRADGALEEVTLYGGDLIWSGSFLSPGTYYVAVDQTGPDPSTITMKVTGTGVATPPTN